MPIEWERGGEAYYKSEEEEVLRLSGLINSLCINWHSSILSSLMEEVYLHTITPDMYWISDGFLY